MEIELDLKLCEGHAQCVMAAPNVFDIPDGSEQALLLDASPPESERAAVEQAAMVCPTGSIRVGG